jgi:hypothetical protein
MDILSDYLLIFKTDIGKLCTNCEVHKLLDTHSEIEQWSIDHEDSDCVLRVKSSTLTPQSVITMVNKMGHKCAEL